MATETVYLTGSAHWAKPFERNRDTADKATHPAVKEKLTQTEGQTSIELHLEQEEWDKYVLSGGRKKGTPTEEGLISVRFTRPWKHGTIEAFGGAPQVVDKYGSEWDDTKSIGNGSVVEVAVSVYDSAAGKGTRWEGVRVLELVEYEEEYQQKLPF